jgi:serine/threonine-protein kinase
VLSLLLVAAIAGGVLAYLATRTVSHTVPEFRNESVEVLRAVADENQWVVGAEQATYDPEVAVGRVVRTDPAAGDDLAEDGTLDYWVSLGPEPVTIPTDLAGKTLDQAAAELDSVGLTVGEATPENHEEITADLVIRANTTETQALPGAAIPVVVSAGPAPRVLAPEWVKQPYDPVAAAMQQQRITPVRVDAYSDTVAAGSVIGFKTVDGAQDLPPGSSVPRDTSVQVLVSQGPAPRPVPNVVGRTLAEADQALRNAGFIPSLVGRTDTRVFATDPSSGSERPFGSTVTVYMRPF